jgi:hypothetical protein
MSAVNGEEERGDWGKLTLNTAQRAQTAATGAVASRQPVTSYDIVLITRKIGSNSPWFNCHGREGV